MIDFATIGIAADTTGVKRAKDDLNRFEKAGMKAADAADKTGGAFTKMGGNAHLGALAVKALVGVFAAAKMVGMIREAAMLSARFETMGVVMRIAGNNAGYTMDQMQGLSKELQKSGISMLQSRNVLTQLATANIDLANATKLGRAAQDLAVVGNVNSSEALQRLVYGIKSGQVEVLRTLGLNLSFEASYKKLASEIGTTSEKLTEQQKTMARTNAALTEAARYSGIYEESMTTAGKAITSLARYWEDLKIKFGDAFLPTLATSVFAVTDALKEMNATMDKAVGGGLIEDMGRLLKSALVTALQAVAITGANVVYVFDGMWREIKGIATQAIALVHGDLKAVTGIRDEMLANNDLADKALRDFEKRMMDVGKTTVVVSKMSEAERIAAAAASKSALEAAEKEAAAAAKRAEDAKKAIKVYEDAIRSARDFVRGLREETEAIGLSAEQTKALSAARAAAKAPTAALRQEIMGATLEWIKATQVQKDAEEAAKALEKANEDLAKSYLDAADDMERALDKAMGRSGRASDDVQRERDLVDAIGMTKEALVELTAVRLEDQAAASDRTAALMDEIDWSGQLGNALREEANALREIAKLKRAGFEKQRDFDEQSAAQKLSDDFSKTLHDDVKSALSNAFRDSKNPAMAFIDGIANVLYTRMTNSLGNSLADALVGNGKPGNSGGLLGGLFGGSFLSGLFSFDGGGSTGNGPRSGGLDGKGGKLAMLHPRETVIDHTKGQSGGGAISITYAPVIQVDSRSDRAQVQADMARLLDKNNKGLVAMLERREEYS